MRARLKDLRGAALCAVRARRRSGQSPFCLDNLEQPGALFEMRARLKDLEQPQPAPPRDACATQGPRDAPARPSFPASRSPFVLFPSPFVLLPLSFSLFPSPFSLLPSPFSLLPFPFSLFPSPFVPLPSPSSRRV